MWERRRVMTLGVKVIDVVAVGFCHILVRLAVFIHGSPALSALTRTSLLGEIWGDALTVRHFSARNPKAQPIRTVNLESCAGFCT